MTEPDAALAALWAKDVARDYRLILLEGAAEKFEVRAGREGGMETKRKRKGMAAGDVAREKERAERGERTDALVSWLADLLRG